MRTALVLLFALALVAIPGSLLPQRPVAPIRVSDWKEANPAVADLYEALGLFDVYGSPWFAAVYLLLTVSLIGCIVPRIAVYARPCASRRPGRPSASDRLPGQRRRAPRPCPPTRPLDAAEAWLRAQRFRVRRDGDSVAAERGYLREFGNILFHLSFALMLVGVAWNTMLHYKGEVVIVEGQAFSNNLTQYDDFSAGGGVPPGEPPALHHLGRLLHRQVRDRRGPARRRAGVRRRRPDRPRRRRARAGDDHRGQPPARRRRHPGPPHRPRLRAGVDGHAIRTGAVAFSGPVVFLPQDGNFTSLGVIKAPDARPNYLGFEGFFLPTAIVDEQGPRSVFPDALAPELFVNVWTGPPRDETGRPESVYSLTKDGLEQMRTPDGQRRDLPDRARPGHRPARRLEPVLRRLAPLDEAAGLR